MVHDEVAPAQAQPISPPRFVVLEGIDGSGTTSQAAALTTWLEGRGHAVLRTREPTSRAIGGLIRARLAADAAPLDPHALALLFAADRMDHVSAEIEPALRSGHIVLSDRYLLSSLAYQSLSASLSWVISINAQAPRPDLNLLIDVPVEIAVARVARRLEGEQGATKEIFDVPETQRRLADAYRRLARRADVGPVRIVDGNAPVDAVTRSLTDQLVRRGL